MRSNRAETAGKKIDQADESAGKKVEKAGEYMHDSAITAKVKAEILSDPLLKAEVNKRLEDLRKS